MLFPACRQPHPDSQGATRCSTTRRDRLSDKLRAAVSSAVGTAEDVVAGEDAAAKRHDAPCTSPLYLPRGDTSGHACRSAPRPRARRCAAPRQEASRRSPVFGRCIRGAGPQWEPRSTALIVQLRADGVRGPNDPAPQRLPPDGPASVQAGPSGSVTHELEVVMDLVRLLRDLGRARQVGQQELCVDLVLPPVLVEHALAKRHRECACLGGRR